MAEVELKLSAVASQLPNLRQALEAMGSTEAAQTSFLTSTSYDSADLKLWNHHLSLRIREGDGKHVQTLKSNSVANRALLSCREWEDVIAGDAPDPTAP